MLKAVRSFNQRNMKILKQWPLLICFLTCQLHAGEYGHLTLFGEVSHSEGIADSIRSEADINPSVAVDILYTYDASRVSVLAEYYLSEDESELERLELGLRLNNWSSIKAGLLHNPAEYWLNEHHNASYSQTSITKPFQSLIGFPGGITNQHLSGVQWLNELTLPNDSTFSFDYTYAASPDLAIEVPDVNVDDFFAHDNALNLSIIHIRFTPFVFNDSSIGISYSDGDVGIEQQSLIQLLGPFSTAFSDSHIDQSTLNIYANIETDRWRFILSHLDEDVTLENSNPIAIAFVTQDNTLNFKLNYLHAEYTLTDHFLMFSRHEKSSPSEDISGLTQVLTNVLDFDLNYEKTIIGTRWDFSKRQAITLQYSDHSTPQNKQNILHLNWSFVWDTGL